MSAFTIPVSIVGGSGKSSALALSVIGLLVLLMLAAQSDATARKQTV